MDDLNERNPSYELILDAAQELFIEQGVGATSLESIARRANVVRATIYNNFRDKDEIITEIVRRYVDGYVDVLAKLREEDQPSQTSFERISNMIRGALRWRIENAALRPLIDQTKHMNNSKWEDLNATADAAMFGWVEEVHLFDAKRGLIRTNLDTEFASRASYSMLEAVISSFDVNSSPEAVDAAAKLQSLQPPFLFRKEHQPARARPRAIGRTKRRRHGLDVEAQRWSPLARRKAFHR